MMMMMMVRVMVLVMVVVMMMKMTQDHGHVHFVPQNTVFVDLRRRCRRGRGQAEEFARNYSIYKIASILGHCTEVQ
jgi:uncharacterized membrane protein